MGDQENKVAEFVWNVEVQSKTGAEHDDEVAWALLQEKRVDIEAAGAHAHLNRSFGGRAQGASHTIITFVAPLASDPKKQVKPEQFFSETDEAAVSITLIAQPDPTPALPKGVKEVPNVAG